MSEDNVKQIPLDELKEDGVYRTYVGDIVKIKAIRSEINQLYIYNISEGCNIYMNLKKHILTQRIR